MGITAETQNKASRDEEHVLIEMALIVLSSLLELSLEGMIKLYDTAEYAADKTETQREGSA